MSTEHPEQFDDGERFDDLRHQRRVAIRHVFREGMELVPLVHALETAKVPRSDEIASLCVERAARSGEDRRVAMSYVYAFGLDFGSRETQRENPSWIINQALLNGSVLSLFSVRDLIWGLLCGLRSLPFKQFPTLYRGINVHVGWEEGDAKFWPCFMATTKSICIAMKFLNANERGEQEGTLITIEGGWGYDFEEFSMIPEEHEVILEPGIEVFVKSIKSGNVIEANVTVVDGQEGILLDRIPRSGGGK